VLLTPAHQFPTGVVLAAQRRRELLRWAAAGERLIIEDDYDAEYRYDRPPVPALQGAAPDLVAYTGSTSKTLAPGMRLGWLVPPRRLHADLVAAKHASDLGCPVLPQLVLAHLITSGELERHIRTVRARQRVRRDALLAALGEHLPQARVNGVAAGLHLLITLPGDADDAGLADRILQAGVLVHPLSLHRVRPGPPGLVLGYAAHAPDRLREAARRIATALVSVTPARPAGERDDRTGSYRSLIRPGPHGPQRVHRAAEVGLRLRARPAGQQPARRFFRPGNRRYRLRQLRRRPWLLYHRGNPARPLGLQRRREPNVGQHEQA
jgi:GntR family transcriptional regulator / MocR family aminotransferase